MEIISVSVSPAVKRRMAEAMMACGCKSRSKLISMAVDSFAKEFEALEGISGTQTAVITVISGEKAFQVSHIAHRYPGMVKLNAHLDSKKGCAEIIVVEGDAVRIREMYAALRNSKEVNSANIALA